MKFINFFNSPPHHKIYQSLQSSSALRMLSARAVSLVFSDRFSSSSALCLGTNSVHSKPRLACEYVTTNSFCCDFFTLVRHLGGMTLFTPFIPGKLLFRTKSPRAPAHSTGLLPILLARTRQHSRDKHHGRDEWVSENTGKMVRSRLAAPAKGCAAMAAG